MDINALIISSLIHNSEYNSKVLPYLDEKYFIGNSYKYLYNLINDHYTQYSNIPSIEVLEVYLYGVK